MPSVCFTGTLAINTEVSGIISTSWEGVIVTVVFSSDAMKATTLFSPGVESTPSSFNGLLYFPLKSHSYS